MPLPKLSRRQFLLLAGLAFVSLVLTLGLSFTWARSEGGLARLVRTTLRKRLPYLTHDPAALDRFAADYVAHMPSSAKRQASQIAMLLPIYAMSNLLSATPARGRVELFENTTVARYLMSSDYFLRSAADDVPLRYVGLYWPPRVLPCSNPFADLST